MNMCVCLLILQMCEKKHMSLVIEKALKELGRVKRFKKSQFLKYSCDETS